jgi:hypothetical protein
VTRVPLSKFGCFEWARPGETFQLQQWRVRDISGALASSTFALVATAHHGCCHGARERRAAGGGGTA